MGSDITIHKYIIQYMSYIYIYKTKQQQNLNKIFGLQQINTSRATFLLRFYQRCKVYLIKGIDKIHWTV